MNKLWAYTSQLDSDPSDEAIDYAIIRGVKLAKEVVGLSAGSIKIDWIGETLNMYDEPVYLLRFSRDIWE